MVSVVSLVLKVMVWGVARLIFSCQRQDQDDDDDDDDDMILMRILV